MATYKIAHHSVTFINADFSTPFVLFVLLSPLWFIYEKPKVLMHGLSKYIISHNIHWYDLMNNVDCIHTIARDH